MVRIDIVTNMLMIFYGHGKQVKLVFTIFRR